MIPKYLAIVRFSAIFMALQFAMVGVANAGKLAFTPASLDFGGNALGERTTLTATLKNTTRAGIALVSARLVKNLGGFAILSTTCGGALPAGEICQYTIGFTSKRLKYTQARLELVTLDPAYPLIKLPLQANRYPMLNDTGIGFCCKSDRDSLCPVRGFPEQDAEYGRDKTRNDPSNGQAGFNFTKLDASGKDLPPTSKAWDCVRDNVTGLVWEEKPKGDKIVGNQGLHDADDRYTWYNTDTSNNGGNLGTDNPGSTCYGYLAAQPVTYCNTEAFVNRINLEGWCGAKDWRLPTEYELLDQVDLSVSMDGPQSAGYWSSTPVASYLTGAWIVDRYGHSYLGYRHNGYAVWLVRGGR
jgi:hypothetical protein